MVAPVVAARVLAGKGSMLDVVRAEAFAARKRRKFSRLLTVYLIRCQMIRTSSLCTSWVPLGIVRFQGRL